MYSLTDYTSFELHTLGKAVILRETDLKQKVEDINSLGKDAQKMFTRELIQLKKEIHSLEDLRVHIETAAVNVKDRETAYLN